jgi:Tfp pilus assembly protein PilP
MKLNTSLLILTFVGGTLWAQNPANKNTKPAVPPPPPAKQAPLHAAAATQHKAAPAKHVAPSAVEHHKVAPKPVVAPAAQEPAHKAPMHEKAPVHKAAPPVAKRAEPGEVKPASVKEPTRVSAEKMRDPFVSPVVRNNGVISSGCDTGKRCLVVDQIVLKGIVKSPSGFIAVVENPAKRAYFMRENDPVFNGKVARITFDTVVFEEQVQDKVGKQTTREVVKKVNAPIV